MKKSLGVFVNALFLSALPGPVAAEGAYYSAAVEAFEKGLKDLPANLYSRLLVQAYLGAGRAEAAESLLRRVTGRTDVRTELAQLEAVLEKRQRAGP